jgi:hypothetical protein
MKKLGWHQWLLLSVFLLAVIVTGLFAVRAVRRAVYWQTHRDEPVRPWMSVRYVSRSYSVPPHVLYEAVRLEPIPHDRRPLREIAREQHRPVEDLIKDLQEAIKGFRAHAPPTQPPLPRPFAPPQAGATP